MFDNSLKRKKYKSSNYLYNYKKELLEKRKIDKDFLKKLNLLTLEDLIFLKLDAASEGLNGKLYNFPILKFSSDITKEAVVRYALSATSTKKEAALILGLRRTELNRLIRIYNIDLKEIRN